MQLDLEEEEATTVDSGSRVWDAGRALARYLATKTTLEGKRVLELGSGTGVVGLTAALAGGAEEVVLTDKPEILPLIQRNMESNGLAPPRCQAVPLMWGEEEASDNLQDFDFVLGSDLLYAPESFDPLLETLAQLCLPKYTQVWLAYPTRFTEDIFFELAYQYHFEDLEPVEEIQEGIFLSKLIYIP